MAWYQPGNPARGDSHGSALRIGDHIKFSCGDHVIDVHDPRHVGRLECVLHSSVAKIKWLESGWFSQIPLSRVRRAEASAE